MCSNNGLTLLYGGDQHNAESSYTPVRKREPKRRDPPSPSRTEGAQTGCFRGAPPLASPARTPPHPADQAPRS